MIKDFSQYKKMLDEEEARLVEELGTVGRRNPENADDWQGTQGETDADTADPNDAADKIEEFETRSAVEIELEKQLELVKKAKQKIEQGDKGGGYSVCEICGEEIEEDRLRANPSAATCKKHMNP